MNEVVKQIIRILITITIAIVAIFLCYRLWIHYMDSPWTRDGRVRADIVNIASDVSGLVVGVKVQDNQFVHKGDVLFIIDSERYKYKVSETAANVARTEALHQIKSGQFKRREMLDEQVVSKEVKEDSGFYASSAKSDYQEALAKHSRAKLDLDRTLVRAPVDGWVTNLLVRPGDFADIGVAKLAIIDQKSFWVYGYFEENKLQWIHVGDKAQIRILGSDTLLKGHVQSISHGITDRDNPTDVRLLANVNPTFNWVRLAQRVPVRIHIDDLPKDVNLVAGMTCTVIINI